MAERYSQLYSLQKNLYAPGSPLVITSGHLLLDSQSSHLFIQLRMRNISDKSISSVKVLFIGYDSSGGELCRENHTYSGLNAARDSIFGSKDTVILPDMVIRSFTVQLLAVSFSDGSQCVCGSVTWQPLPEQISLNVHLFDAELVRQYQLETTDMSQFLPVETQDIWLCACGEINRKGTVCYQCGQTLEKCKSCLNLSFLRENKSLRLSNDAIEEAISEEKRQSIGKTLLRVFLVLLPVMITAALILGVYKFSSIRSSMYNEATRLYEVGEFADAAVLFGKLGDFHDSKDLLTKCKRADAEIASYERAGKLLENGRWDDAYAAYAELGDYADSAELAKKSLYQKGCYLIEEGQYEEACAVFDELGEYLDSSLIASHFFYRLLSEEVSLNMECGGPLTTSYAYDSQGRIEQKTEHFSAYNGMEDRTYIYHYNPDGSYSISEGQVERHYDAHGSYLGQGNRNTSRYEYEFYPDGSVHFSVEYDAATGAHLSSLSYDEKGNINGILRQDGSIQLLINEYEQDLLVKQETCNEDGSLVSRITYEYDDHDMLKRTSFLSVDGSATVTTLYTNGLVYAKDAVK